MKEKINNLWTKAKEFAEDHASELLIAASYAMCIALIAPALRSLRLFNLKTKLEIEKLKM